MRARDRVRWRIYWVTFSHSESFVPAVRSTCVNSLLYHSLTHDTLLSFAGLWLQLFFYRRWKSKQTETLELLLLCTDKSDATRQINTAAFPGGEWESWKNGEQQRWWRLIFFFLHKKGNEKQDIHLRKAGGVMSSWWKSPEGGSRNI